MFDYSISYKTKIENDTQWATHEWDLFLSAYSLSERVLTTFSKVTAKHKHWLVFPEYGFNQGELPEDDKFICEHRNEADYISSYWCWANRKNEIPKDKVCVDITGFIRPYMIFLMKWLKENGIKKFDVIYSEPNLYSKRENTIFSNDNVIVVKQIPGFEGAHIPDTSKDIMVIGVGYEEHLIAHASENKENARKIQVFGFPSLSADMYQENVLKAQKAEEEVGAEAESFFAPANDPFITANIVSGHR